MIHSMEELLVQASHGTPMTISVACAHDHDVLRAVLMAQKEGVANAVLTGRREKICEILRELGANENQFPIYDAETDGEGARIAVQLVREGKAGFLMKGLLATAELMRAVIDKENGLRTERLISHVMMYQVPAYPKPLFLTDGGMNTYPDLPKKADILENAAIVVRALGYEKIYAAAICGAEDVNPKIQATVDAAALADMHDRWKPYNMVVSGPMGFDLAISKSACEHKRYQGEAGGKADILLVPTYEVGNGIGKAMMFFGGAKGAGIIVGAKVPIVLVSRSDTAETKLASIALGAVVSRNI